MIVDPAKYRCITPKLADVMRRALTTDHGLVDVDVDGDTVTVPGMDLGGAIAIAELAVGHGWMYDADGAAAIRHVEAALRDTPHRPTDEEIHLTGSAIAGRTFARTTGVPCVGDTDTRFRMRIARVGRRVVDLHHPTDGRHVATLRENADGWQVHTTGVAGDAHLCRSRFVDAQAAAWLAGDILAVPLPPDDADSGKD